MCMEKWFETTFENAMAIVISCIGIYVAVILYTRIFGKRSFSKMSSFDFAMTVAVGSVIATTILSKSVSLLDGVIGLLAVYLLQFIAAYFRRFQWFQNLIDNKPLLIMKDDIILYDNLKKARVTEGDLRSKLREANVLNFSQVRAVIFETTGDIVVMHTNNSDTELAPWLLQDVKLK